jgi:hypothetical protein
MAPKYIVVITNNKLVSIQTYRIAFRAIIFHSGYVGITFE